MDLRNIRLRMRTKDFDRRPGGNQHPGQRHWYAARGWRQVDLFEKANCVDIQIAHRLGLQTIGEHRKEKMSGEVRWRVLPEACPPSGA